MRKIEIISQSNKNQIVGNWQLRYKNNEKVKFLYFLTWYKGQHSEQKQAVFESIIWRWAYKWEEQNQKETKKAIIKFMQNWLSRCIQNCANCPHFERIKKTFSPIDHFFSFFFFLISWRLITLQYCSGFCHTLTWISHGFTCISHPDPPFHLPLYPVPLGLPSAPAQSTCLMHPTWAGDLFHPR